MQLQYLEYGVPVRWVAVGVCHEEPELAVAHGHLTLTNLLWRSRDWRNMHKLELLGVYRKLFCNTCNVK